MNLAKKRTEDYCHCAIKLDYCKIGLKYSLICQGKSTRRQRSNLFGCGMKLSLVTTSLRTQIKVEAIRLSALPKDTTKELAGFLSLYSFFMLNVRQGSC